MVIKLINLCYLFIIIGSEMFYMYACQAVVGIPNWPVLICVHYYLTFVALRNEPGYSQPLIDIYIYIQ